MALYSGSYISALRNQVTSLVYLLNVVLCLATSTALANSTHTVSLSASTPHTNIGDLVEWKVSDSGSLLSDVVEATDWQVMPDWQQFPADQSVWAKIDLQNPTSSPQDLLLNFQQLSLDNIEVFVVDGMQRILVSYRAGTTRADNLRPIEHRHFLFPIPLNPQQAATLYIKINDNGPFSKDISLWRDAEFWQQDQRIQRIYGVVIGGVALLAIYFFLTYLLLHNPVRYWFSVAVGASLFAILSAEGVLGLMTGLLQYSQLITISFIALALYSISKSAHGMMRRVPLYWRYVAYGLPIAMVVSAIVVDEYWQVIVGTGLGGAAVLLQLILALLFHHEHSTKPNRLYAFGWLLISAGCVVKVSLYLAGMMADVNTGLLLTGIILSGLICIALAVEAHELDVQRSHIVTKNTAIADLNQFYTLYRKSAEGIYIATLNGQLLSINPAMFELFGFDSEEQMFEEVADTAQLFASEQEVEKMMALLSVNKVVLGLELTGKKRDGETFPMSASCQLISEEGQDFLFGSIFERKQSFESLTVADSEAPKDPATQDDALHRSLENVAEHHKLQSAHEVYWVSQIHHALSQHSFQIWQQPIRSLNSPSQSPHYELLLRMLDQNNETVPARVFLPPAVRYGLAPQIDRWVVEHYFAWLAARPEHLVDLHLAHINLSDLSLGVEDLILFIQHAFTEYQIPGEKICFELSEKAVLEQREQVQFVIDTLAPLGCQFAIDDFGSHLAAHPSLRQLPMNYVKIDKAVIDTILDDPINQAVVASVRDLCKLSGLSIIAEGVESSDILVQLGALGIPYAQGYVFSPPVKLEVPLNADGATPNTTSMADEAP